MEYTVTFMFYHDLKHIILVLKERSPDPGCLSGVGGAIEPFDSCPTAAALREIAEESGIVPRQLSARSKLFSSRTETQFGIMGS